MPKLIPVQTVLVHRDGKTVAAPLEVPFEFSDAEVADIMALNPDAVREPINEAPVEVKAPATAPKATAPAAAPKAASGEL